MYVDALGGAAQQGEASGLQRVSAAVLRWTSVALAATVWLSAGLFGLYILAFYAGAFAADDLARWNEVLPRLYEPETPLATVGIGIHFAAGGVILALGFIQLINPLRQRFPALHRWVGRLYVAAALLAGLGGLAFIATKGTLGGVPMDIGFSLYGVLVVLAAVQTFWHAWRGRFEAHRAWALRLFALAIGSWLYRMDYGFWFILTNGAGHTRTFSGPFDVFMSFFFYLPNLLVVEAFLRARRGSASPALKLASAAVLLGVTVFLLIGTYFFTQYYWGPAILAAF